MTGVVVMAYGSPERLEDLEAFYTDIRRGRPPDPDQLAVLRARYEAIGGTSPLRERTASQVAAIAAALETAAPGRFRVALGYRHASPSIEDAVAGLLAAGERRLVTVVLAPHHHPSSVGVYEQRVEASAGDAEVRHVGGWGLLDELVGFHARGLRSTLAEMPAATKVLFTAHSLPTRVLGPEDPYAPAVAATAAAVADRAGLTRWAGWSVCFQSAGATPEPWLGPDLGRVIGSLAGTGRAEGVVVCPVGFTADHLEILYDLDIEARDLARGLGLRFARTPMPNDDPGVASGLARLIAAAGEEG